MQYSDLLHFRYYRTQYFCCLSLNCLCRVFNLLQSIATRSLSDFDRHYMMHVQYQAYCSQCQILGCVDELMYLPSSPRRSKIALLQHSITKN